MQNGGPLHILRADEDVPTPLHPLQPQRKVSSIATSASAARVRGAKGQPRSASGSGSGQSVTPETQQLLAQVEAVLEDMKSLEIKVIPLAGMTSFADFMVIASGTSTRHVASIGHALHDKLKPHIIGLEGLTDGEWVCADLGDIVVHIFLPEKRALYNLEKLWSDVFA